jgi:hypothetical protein
VHSIFVSTVTAVVGLCFSHVQVLEVKTMEGLGTTVDVVLVNTV